MSTKHNAGQRITPQQARKEIAAILGVTDQGDRDVYEQAGYPKEISFEEFLGAYERADIARRVVDTPAKETWRKLPEVLDGDTDSDAVDDTQFVKDWEQLANGRFTIDSEMLGIFHYLTRLDIRSGIGGYGGLFLGLNDSAASAADELVQGSARGLDALLYLTVFDEGQMTIDKTDEDTASPRYGLPLTYTLTTENGDETVHWSRIVHVAEDAEIVGSSRLEIVFNRIRDIEKIMAASGEGAWRSIVPRLAALAREGFKQGDPDVIDEQFQNFINGLTRVLSIEGTDVQEFAGSIVDPSGALAACIRLIAAATEIPQRKLLGAEAGELASSQDEENWITVVESRRVNHAQPVILQRTINRLIYAGVLTPPTKGVIVKWPALREIDRLELAELGNKAADAMIKLGVSPDVVDFLLAYFPDIDPSKIAPAEADSKAPEDKRVEDETDYP